MSYLMDLHYARQRQAHLGAGCLMGFAESGHDEASEYFLGYDIIDGFCDVSLLTNWGNDVERVNRALASNALVPTFAEVESVHDFLLSNFADDNHVKGCRIRSVYSTGPA